MTGRWSNLLTVEGKERSYLVRDTSGAPSTRERRKKIQKAIATLVGAGEDSRYNNAALQLAEEIRQIVSESQTPLGALKELLPFDEAASEDESAALGRMKRELSTLKTVSHPSLVKVLDSNLDERWFVMEYLEGGTLSKHLGKYKGRVLDALRDFRSIVDAVSALHTKKVVHRDIKPDNIFVASDGRLVLADCGLAFKLEDQERLTQTFENVGTRDFQPPWSHGMRLAEVRPTFDVFSLAKVLWAMVSGRPKFPFWYFEMDEHDLRQMFPGEPAIQYVQDILGKCIVEFEDDTRLRDACELLEEVDTAISALSRGCQQPGWNAKMRCRFCGIGQYQLSDSYQISGGTRTGYERTYYLCDYCGHLQAFHWPMGKAPPVWIEST